MALRAITPWLKLDPFININGTDINRVAKTHTASYTESRQHRLCRAFEPTITIITIIIDSNRDNEETYPQASEYKSASDAPC